ncbi:hypothetical protein DSBG_1346 [Desulfosporosinus sp. BG]|nr:hypothetical protein DSBG_1346 [Desulfosporosinus sp. BG]
MFTYPGASKIPVKAVSKKFREKFLYYFKKAFEEGKISFFNAAKLSSESNFSSFVDGLYFEKGFYV